MCIHMSMPSAARLPRAERRVQLIDAAATAFLERGYDNTSMEDVARQAGVSRLILYRIFDSKAALYRSVLETVLHAIAETFVGMESARVHEEGAANLILRAARRYPDAFRLLWRHSLAQPEFAEYGEIFQREAMFHAREILHGYIDDPTVLEWASQTAGSHLIDGICLWLDAGDPARDDQFAAMVNAGLRALADSWASVIDPAATVS